MLSIHKFGGTSVGRRSAMPPCRIIEGLEGERVVVVSA